MKRLALWVVFAIFVSAGAWIAFRSKPSNNAKTRKIVVAQYGDFFLYAPLYIAHDAGFFAKNDLDVSFTSTGGDEKTWAAVMSGDAAFGVADPTFVAISDAQGRPGVVVASLVDGVPFWGVTLRSDIAPLHSPKDLDGHSVATFPAPSTAYTLQAQMFKDGGLQPNIRQAAFGTLMTLLRNRQADIALELEPNVSQAAHDGARVIYSMKDIYGAFAITGLTTSPKTMRENGDLVQRTVCSLQMATDYIRKDKGGALAMLQRRFPEVSPDIARAALDRVVAENIIPPTLETDAKAWQQAINLRVQAGDLHSAKPMNAYVDNSAASWAKQNCR